MQSGAKRSFSDTFSALKHKNYRYYFVGMGVSLVGTWMQNIAQPWLAYTLTDSPLLLSLVGAMQFLPMLLFSLFSGVIIDKFDKKKLLYITQKCISNHNVNSFNFSLFRTDTVLAYPCAGILIGSGKYS